MASASNGTVTSPTDTETVTAVQTKSLTIVKTATPSTYSAVGNIISYSYLVTNNGNVTLSGPFTVSDDKATDEACPATPTSLAPGASVTCTASYTITQADLDAGHSARTWHPPPTAAVTSPTDTETVTAVQTEVAVDREDGDAEHLQRGGQRHQLQLPGDQQRQRDVERAVHGE